MPSVRIGALVILSDLVLSKLVLDLLKAYTMFSASIAIVCSTDRVSFPSSICAVLTFTATSRLISLSISAC